jgi:type IV pilus assembly protein PilB
MEDKLLKLLYEDNIITQDQYQKLAEKIAQGALHLEAALQQAGILSEENWVKFLSQKFRMPVVNWKDFQLNQEVFGLVPAALAKKYSVFPYAFERGKRGGRITLVVADPTEVAAFDDISFRSGCIVRTAISSFRAIQEAIDQYYEGQASAPTGPDNDTRRFAAAQPITKIEAFDTPLAAMLQGGEAPEEEPDVFSILDHDHPSTKYLLEMLETALARNVSEIHLEPGAQEFQVRWYGHGICQQSATVSEMVGRGIILRLKKILQRADPTAVSKKETSTWNVSFSTTQLRGERITVFVSLFPTINGDKIRLKITTPAALLPLEKLGLADPELKQLGRMLAKPEGLILLVAPPKHGVTTTLYSFLHQFDRATSKIVSFESPAELMIPGVTQMALHPTISYDEWYSFLVYSAPDVIAFGALHNDLLARLAFEFSASTQVVAACTAHDAFTGVGLLAEILSQTLRRSCTQVTPVLIETINGIVVQRLVKTLCPHCKQDAPKQGPDQELLQWAMREGDQQQEFPAYRSPGCQHCQNTGYLGQTGLFEIVRCDKQVKQLLLQPSPLSSSQWQRALTDMSVTPLKRQGLKKVREGLISLHDLRQALGE